ncbi:PAS domain-containing sensor histidine kinase [Marinobacter caseinilyticus]|uniref:PAS domain-containing sensor histidine kinase n=1 Tax=Marinobacter caseinilyticus TaxID=2692195 RepID=UPI00140D0EFE|nr:PAS domain S-box protein [Marinobacter caseinilyticus]
MAGDEGKHIIKASQPWDDLRQAAVQRLEEQHPALEDLEPGDLHTLVYELSVHKLELQLQNEELRSVHDELERARDRYFTLYERAPVAYLTLTDEGRISSCNRAACDLLKCEKSDIIGTDLHEFIHPAWQDELYKHRRQLYQTSRRQKCEIQVRRPDGQARFVLLESELSDESGSNQSFWYVSMADIDAQKAVEDELSRLNSDLEKRVEARAQQYKESRQEMESILNAVADPIITMDGRGLVESANRSAEKLLGYSLDQLVGHNICLLLSDPDMSNLEQFMHERLSNAVVESRILRCDVTVLNQSGERIPVELGVSQIDHRNKFTAILRDTREKKRLQREVMQVAENERSRISRELHDSLGQELAAMSLSTMGQARTYSGKDDSVASAFSAFSQRLQHAIKQLRTIIFDLAPLDVSDSGLVEALESLARAVSADNSVSCSCHIEAGQAESVIDSEKEIQLLRIAQEAVHNARKHAGAQHIVIALRKTGQNLRLQIIDDGKGISLPSNDRIDGQGIRIMNYRAQLIGAELSVQAYVPHGTLVSCNLPL